MKRALTCSALAAALLSCHESSSTGTPFPAGTHNLGLQASAFRFEGNALVANSLESPGRDLNGDGDTSDAVLEIIDLESGARTTIPLAVNRAFEVGGGFVSFTVTECAQNEDLDGDGDVDCAEVLHIHELATRRTRNLGLPLHPGVGGTRPLLTQEGSVLAFVVSEAAFGMDLDGDGFAGRSLAYVYEAELERLTPLLLATTARPILEAGRVFVGAVETPADLNGDGDTSDMVVQSYDVASGHLENLARATTGWRDQTPLVLVEGSLLALGISELGEGADRNGDGDTNDLVAEIRDLESGSIVPTLLSIGDLVVHGGVAAIYAPERAFLDVTGTDYDGDGELVSTVPFFYDWLTGTLTNGGVAANDASPMSMGSERRAAFLAAERFDLNGDDDTLDRILTVFDARTGVTTATGIGVFGDPGSLDLVGRHVAFIPSGNNDAPTDGQAVLMDLETGEQRTLAASAASVELEHGRALISVRESAGEDLNGDGDTEDLVARLVDLETGATLETGLAIPSGFFTFQAVAQDANRVALLVMEFSQGQDLNGDGDQEDLVLHVVVLP